MYFDVILKNVLEHSLKHTFSQAEVINLFSAWKFTETNYHKFLMVKKEQFSFPV
jgi:hypothetical protein